MEFATTPRHGHPTSAGVLTRLTGPPLTVNQREFLWRLVNNGNIWGESVQHRMPPFAQVNLPLDRDASRTLLCDTDTAGWFWHQ